MIPFPSTGDIPRPKPVTPEGGSIKASHIAAGLAVTLIATAFCLRALFTCVGPVAVGAMHDATSEWGPGLLFLICIAASLVVLGYLIGRDVVIGCHEA